MFKTVKSSTATDRKFNGQNENIINSFSSSPILPFLIKQCQATIIQVEVEDHGEVEVIRIGQAEAMADGEVVLDVGLSSSNTISRDNPINRINPH